MKRPVFISIATDINLTDIRCDILTYLLHGAESFLRS